MDLSNLDKKYFIDEHVYNCPFCRRNNVSYAMEEAFCFNWSPDKRCYGYIVRCLSNGCGNRSLHLSFKELREDDLFGYKNKFSNQEEDIDSHLFFSQPTSYFVLDNRIPEKIRKLVHEAENSQRSNFLVGATACLRKAIYELLEHEEAIVKNPENGRANYQDSVKKLKEKFSFVSPELFDALGNIQQMTSDNVHEGSWESWDSPKIKIIIELTKSVLHEMYVVPEETKERLKVLTEIHTEFKKSTKPQES